MLQWADKDFKVSILKVFKHVKESKFMLGKEMWNIHFYLYQENQMEIILNLKIKSILNFYYKILTIFLKGLERIVNLNADQ